MKTAYEMNRKGDGLSLNVIVVALIALIVLVVLVVVFSSKMGNFTKGINSCEDKGGKPISTSTAYQDCVAQGGTPNPYYDKTSGKQISGTVCCMFGE